MWMWGVFLPIYINQPLGQNTPKLPYGEPLVWEISHVVNYIFLLFLSPSLLPSPSPPHCPAQPSSLRQQVRSSAMFLSISNVAASDRVFAPDNLLFVDQQSQGTSLGSLRLSIIVCINPPQHNCPINFSSEELPWPALLYSLSASRKLLHHHRSSILSPSGSWMRSYSTVRVSPAGQRHCCPVRAEQTGCSALSPHLHRPLRALLRCRC